MADEFNPNATDGDGDGFVQDGTEWERPVEEPAIVDEPVEAPQEVEDEVVVEDAPAPEAEEDTSFVVTSDDKPSTKNKKRMAKPALAPVADGVIGSATSSEPEPVVKASKTIGANSVALFSTRNVRWEGVGSIFRGYNIVSTSDSEKWLERPHVRVATPEEIAREFKS